MQSKNHIEKRLAATLLTAREQRLLPLLFGGTPTADDIHALTDGLDLDAENANYMLLLSCLGYAGGWALFPPAIIPRLKGIHRYHQVHNAMGVPWLARQLGRLADGGIPVMLLKGIAMRAFYAPNVPRPMWDFDIAVPPGHYREAIGLLCAGGCTIKGEAAHSTTLCGEAELDLHRWIFKTGGEGTSGVWDHAVPFDFHGVGVWVPAPEDMFLHQLDTQSRNLFIDEGAHRRLKWLYDCRSILQATGGLDLAALAHRAAAFSSTYRARLMLRLFVVAFPDAFPPAELDAAFPPSAGYERWLTSADHYSRVWQHHQAYGFPPGAAMTPLHALHSFRLSLAQYRYLRPELKAADPRINFYRYLKKMYQAEGPAALAGSLLKRLGCRRPAEAEKPGATG